MITDQNDSIKELISKNLAGETTPAEEQQLSTWLGLSNANKELYAEFKRAFDAGSQFYSHTSDVNSINADDEWTRFTNTITQKKSSRDNTRTLVPESKPSISWMRAAAALILIVVSGAIVNYFISINRDTVFQTAENTMPVTLPDGSQVVLNANSSLSYSSSFGEVRREVTLKGEAFFDIAHDGSKPFVISAHTTEIEVLGTSFNVLAYDSGSEVSVTVQTGIVKLSVPETKEEIKLIAGERGVYSKTDKQLRSTVNEDANFLSWNTHKLVFAEKDLRSVIASINKAYNANIRIATTVSPTCVITVSFEGQTLEAILNVLKSTLNLTYTEKDGQIEIVSAGC